MSGERFLCLSYRCEMRVEACVARQKNAIAWVGRADGFGYKRPGAGDVNCRHCDQGRQVAAGVSAEAVREYRRALSSVRRVRMEIIEQAAQTPPTGEERTMSEEQVQYTAEAAQPAVPMHACGRCGVEKPFTRQYFDTTKNTKSGLVGTCRKCRAESDRVRRLQRLGRWTESDNQAAPAVAPQVAPVPVAQAAPAPAPKVTPAPAPKTAPAPPVDLVAVIEALGLGYLQGQVVVMVASGGGKVDTLRAAAGHLARLIDIEERRAQ